MTVPSWLQIAVTLVIVFLLSIPTGRYLCGVVTERLMLIDPVFDRIDNGIYLLIGRRATSMPMNWRSYTFHMLATNLVMAIIIYLILVLQDRLPLNPLNFPAMEPMLAFNTAISFITNTDWQGYGGETTLSNFSQMAAITFPMFTSAATGFVVAMAFIRSFIVKDGGANLGNFYRDVVRFTTRVLVPISFALSLFMICQGSPQTLDAEVIAHPIPGGKQVISIGPVAALETIKHVGTNGGGFFNANAAHPYENPTPLTSVVLAVSMALLHLEHCRFWDGCSRSKLRKDLRMGFQCPPRFGITRIMLGNHVTPLRANKPGAVLFLAHGRGPPGVSSRMRAEIPQSRRHSSAISASSRGIWRTRAPLVTLR